MKNQLKKIIGLFVFGISILAMAADTEKKKDGGRPFEIPEFPLIHQKPKDSGTKFEVNCETKDGRVYKRGEPGFEGCLSDLQRDIEQKNQVPRHSTFEAPPPGGTPPLGPSIQFKMKIGD